MFTEKMLHKTGVMFCLMPVQGHWSWEYLGFLDVWNLSLGISKHKIFRELWILLLLPFVCVLVSKIPGSEMSIVFTFCSENT